MKVISVIAMVSVLILVTGVVAGFRYADKPEMRVDTYRVEIGDTLWKLSSKYCPNEMDPREWIYEVRKLNELANDDYLLPGVEIQILKEAQNG